MRLINTDTLKLEEFVGNKIPDYAILSHTWGSSEEEVTFNDFNSKIRKKKVGFEKILKTCEKAKAEGISYAWVRSEEYLKTLD